VHNPSDDFYLYYTVNDGDYKVTIDSSTYSGVMKMLCHALDEFFEDMPVKERE
jgi:hypothetical protein